MSEPKITSDDISKFRKIVWNYYHNYGREMPWRNDYSDYSVFISEVMLQQTPVNRVLPKYEHFLYTFPDFLALSKSTTTEVLLVWKGLGYNRRALRLRAASKLIIKNYGGNLPADIIELQKLPGIGFNTAGAIMTYVFNEPVVFIETNIRRVFIHHFWPSSQDVHDKQIAVLAAESIRDQEPRQWYWALMDYGSFLGRTIPNPNRKSKHYVMQAAFEGSHRQLRGLILNQALQGPTTNTVLHQLHKQYSLSQVERAVQELLAEGFLSKGSQGLTIRDNNE